MKLPFRWFSIKKSLVISLNLLLSYDIRSTTFLPRLSTISSKSRPILVEVPYMGILRCLSSDPLAILEGAAEPG